MLAQHGLQKLNHLPGPLSFFLSFPGRRFTSELPPQTWPLLLGVENLATALSLLKSFSFDSYRNILDQYKLCLNNKKRVTGECQQLQQTSNLVNANLQRTILIWKKSRDYQKHKQYLMFSLSSSLRSWHARLHLFPKYSPSSLFTPKEEIPEFPFILKSPCPQRLDLNQSLSTKQQLWDFSSCKQRGRSDPAKTGRGVGDHGDGHFGHSVQAVTSHTRWQLSCVLSPEDGVPRSLNFSYSRHMWHFF